MANGPAGDPQGLFDASRQLLHSAVAHLGTRLQLLGLEVQREQRRLATLLATAVLSWMLTGLTLLLMALAVVAFFWETPWRMHSVVATVAVFAIGAMLARQAVSRMLAEPSHLFSVSLAELHKDEAALRPPSAGAAGASPTEGRRAEQSAR